MKLKCKVVAAGGHLQNMWYWYWSAIEKGLKGSNQTFLAAVVQAVCGPSQKEKTDSFDTVKVAPSFRFWPTMHNGPLSQSVKEGSLLRHLKRHTSWTLPNSCSGLPKHGLLCHAFIWCERSWTICPFLFGCLIYDNPSQVVLLGWFHIYNYMLFLCSP